MLRSLLRRNDAKELIARRNQIVQRAVMSIGGIMTLVFNMHGYVFQEGVKTLQRSFAAAIAPLTADVERRSLEATTYQKSLADGGEWIGERDEDGYVLWDQETVLEMQLEGAQAAQMALRKAFAILAYHHWERSARGWSKSLHGKHLRLVELTKKQGYPIDARMGALRDLANALKHENPKWGEQLKCSWPEVFSDGFNAPSPAGSWYEAICLSDDDIGTILDAVARSGPKWNSA